MLRGELVNVEASVSLLIVKFLNYYVIVLFCVIVLKLANKQSVSIFITQFLVPNLIYLFCFVVVVQNLLLILKCKFLICKEDAQIIKFY